MPLNRLPQGVSSTLDAGLLGGLSSSTWASSIRAGYSIYGGGTVSVSATGAVSWSQRFIVMSVGRGSFFSTTGYYDITPPPVGTVIPGFGAASDVIVTTDGIPIPSGWHTLYYELPLGSNNASVASNFRIVLYQSNFDIPIHWVPICRVNGDSGIYHFPNGMNLTAGTSGTSGVTGTGAVVRANSPTFTGTTIVNNLSAVENITVSTGNTTGGGIILADDGDMVDMNNGFLSLRFSNGVQVYSGNKSGSAAITLSNSGSLTTTGTIIAPASTTSTPSLRIPHGTAPSAPTNGDIWTTASGLFSYINGGIQQYSIISDIYQGTGANLNNIVVGGMYRLGPGIVNGPTGESWGNLLVIRGGLDTIGQIYTGFTGDMWYRNGNPTEVGGSGTWSAWKKVSPSHLSTTAPGSTPYTLALTNDGNSVEMNFAGANTLTIPLNSSVAFPIGTQIIVVQTGAGQTTLSPTGGVTLNGTPGLKLRAQWSSATLIKRNTNTWLAIGDLAA